MVMCVEGCQNSIALLGGIYGGLLAVLSVIHRRCVSLPPSPSGSFNYKASDDKIYLRSYA